MTVAKFYVGQKGMPPDAALRIEDLLTAEFGGVTRYSGVGAWRSPSGDIVKEYVAVYEVMVGVRQAKDASLQKIASIIRDIAKQTSVLLTEQECDGDFI